jgi:hypothetical protein
VRPVPLPELTYIAMLLGAFVVTFLVSNGLARLTGYKE